MTSDNPPENNPVDPETGAQGEAAGGNPCRRSTRKTQG